MEEAEEGRKLESEGEEVDDELEMENEMEMENGDGRIIRRKKYTEEVEVEKENRAMRSGKKEREERGRERIESEEGIKRKEME